MEDTELLRLFIDTLSNHTREITRLVDKQQVIIDKQQLIADNQQLVIVEFKNVIDPLQKIEYGITNGLRLKIRDDMYTVSGECKQDWLEIVKSIVSRLYFKIVLAIATMIVVPSVILILMRVYGG